MKNVGTIRFYSKIISKEKSNYQINKIFSIHQSSLIKLHLAKFILSNESYDVYVPIKDQYLNYQLAKELSKESDDMGNLKGMILYSSKLCLNTKNMDIFLKKELDA